jgi:cytochrome c peroxidase
VVDFYNSRDSKPQCASPLTPVQAAIKQGCCHAPDYPETVNRSELGNLQISERERTDLVAFLETLSDQPASMRLR